MAQGHGSFLVAADCKQALSGIGEMSLERESEGKKPGSVSKATSDLTLTCPRLMYLASALALISPGVGHVPATCAAPQTPAPHASYPNHTLATCLFLWLSLYLLLLVLSLQPSLHHAVLQPVLLGPHLTLTSSILDFALCSMCP